MTRGRKVAIALVLGLSVLVVSAAVAATKALTPRQERQAVINDAARQLGVEPQELSNALKQALKNRVDAAVKDGRLTQQQAARLKERIDAGGAPLFGLGPGPGFRHHHGHGPFHMKFEAAARYLDMTRTQLREALQDGKTLAQVARDKGKSVDGLVDALVAEKQKRLEQAVQDGRLTEAEKDDMVAGLKERITDLVNGRFPPRFHRRPGRTTFFAERPPIF
jgi:predicted DNA-binding protein (UPF0251 family)